MVRGSVDAPEKFWTFCPTKRFPKDKVLIKKCESCPHFKGYRMAFDDKVLPSLPDQTKPRQMFGPSSPVFTLKMRKPSDVTEKDLIEALKNKEAKDEEWEKEEKRVIKDE